MSQERVTVPRDRLILPSQMLGTLFSSATFTSISPFLTKIADDLGISVGLAGQITSASSLAAVLAGLTSAPFASSLPPKRVLTGLLMIVGVGSIGSALVAWFPALLAMQFVTGAASSMIAATALMTLGMTQQDAHQRARHQSLLLGSLGLGALLIAPLLRWVASMSSWQAGVGFYGLLAVVAAGVLAVIHPPVPAITMHRRLAPRARIRDAASAIRLPGIGATICTSFLIWCSWGLIGTFLAGFFLDAYPGSDGLVSMLWLADGLGYLIGATFGGTVIARVANPSRSLLVGLVAMTATIVPFAWLTPTPLATIITFFTWVVALGIATNAIIALYNHLGGTHTPSLLFLDSAIGKIAILAGSVVGGVAIDVGGYESWAIALMFTTVAAATVPLIQVLTSDSFARRRTGHAIKAFIATPAVQPTVVERRERDRLRLHTSHLRCMIPTCNYVREKRGRG